MLGASLWHILQPILFTIPVCVCVCGCDSEPSAQLYSVASRIFKVFGMTTPRNGTLDQDPDLNDFIS